MVIKRRFLKDTKGNTIKRAYGYANLQKRSTDIDPPAKMTDDNKTFEQEWEHLVQEVECVAKESGWQCNVDNGFSISCVRVDNISFNGNRAVREIVFCKDEKENKIRHMIKHHERLSPTDVVSELEEQMLSLDAVEKARFMLNFIGGSLLCSGFQVADDYDEENSHLVSYNVRNLSDPVATTEKRLFCKSCQVVTKIGSKTCSKCSDARDVVLKKIQRKEMRGNQSHPFCNHRYMTKANMVSKVHEMKKTVVKEKKENEIMKEMIEIDDSDHFDLSKIFENLKKRDVPEEMSLLWKQQQKILQTSKSSGYRWHPRFSFSV